MASETKVGLLVGLGFIVCFAVILANRGRDGQIDAQLPYSLLVPPPDGGSPMDHDSTRPARTSRPAERRVPTAHVASPNDRPLSWARSPARGVGADSDMVGQSIAGLRRSNDVALRSSDERVTIDPRRTRQPALSGNRDQRRIEAKQQRTAVVDSVRPANRAGDPLTQHFKSVDREGSGSFTQEETRRLQALVDKAAPSPPGSHPNKTARPAGAISGKKYTVVSGDSLYRIARKRYGDDSRELVRAIFEANRTVLSHEDEVQVGDELFLPDVSTKRASPSPAGAPNAKPRRGRPDGSSATPARRREGSRPFRWYQVEKNDRYTTIAAAQLGDSRRWEELFELNRDIFPDPDRIRTGVKIRIPTVEVAAARGGRR